MSAKPLKKCPECKKRKLKRLITGGAGFILKGDGWAGKDIKKKKLISEHDLMKKAKKAGRKDIVDKINKDRDNSSFSIDSKDKPKKEGKK